MVVYDSGIILRSSARRRARRGGGMVASGFVEDGIRLSVLAMKGW